MTTIFPGPAVKTDGTFEWRERMFDLKDIYLIRQCGTKLEINYKLKPKELIRCSPEELSGIYGQILNPS